MHSYNNVNKYLFHKNASEEVLIKRLEEQEAKQKGELTEEEKKEAAIKVANQEAANGGGKEKKWKQKFIKIW